MKPIVIAEPGSTHDGNLDAMHALIDVAADAGCWAYKSQWLSSPERLANQRNATEYLEAYRRLAYPFEWHAELAQHVHARGMVYVCSVYLMEDITRLANAVDYLKIASFESSVLSDLAESHKPDAIIVSLGFGNLPSFGRIPWAILHCVSAYPTPLEQANLGRIRELAVDYYRIARAGFSDHTRHVMTGAYAVAAGAQVLEVHYRLDDTPTNNPDYVVSLTPSELRDYVAYANEAAVMLGDGSHMMQAAEEPFARYRAR